MRAEAFGGALQQGFAHLPDHGQVLSKTSEGDCVSLLLHAG